MAWMLAAKVDEVQAGKPKLVRLKGKDIGLFYADGNYFAVLNQCPHQGAPICLGKVTGMVTSDGPGKMSYNHERQVLRCPWHHWEFDLASGKALAPIKQRLKIYPVMLRDSDILVDVP